MGMKFRDISILTAEQRERLAELEDAIVDQDMHLEVYGLHPSRDELVCEVECPYDGFSTKDVCAINVFVFNRTPKLELTAEGIAADFALRRDTSYGL
jgi:hypothetical protein